MIKCRFYLVDLRRVAVSEQWSLKAGGLLIQVIFKTGLTVQTSRFRPCFVIPSIYIPGHEVTIGIIEVDCVTEVFCCGEPSNDNQSRVIYPCHCMASNPFHPCHFLKVRVILFLVKTIATITKRP